MTFDGIYTRAMIKELQALLTGGRINKIDQPFDNEAILTIRNNRTNYRLLLSANPQYARVQLTDLKYQNPMQPPQFVMVLRKHLNRALLTEIKQVDNDRIIIFSFQNRDELGDEQELHLVAEIMGRHSNVLLIDKADDRILELIRHVPHDQNSYRTLLPGASYIQPPSQDKLNPFTASDDQILQAVKEHDEGDFSKAVMSSLQGVGKQAARELASRADDLAVALPAVVEDLEASLAYGKTQPRQYVDGAKAYFTPVEFEVFDSLEKLVYDSLSASLDDYYQDKAQRDRVHQMAGELETLLKNESKKNKKKLAKQEREYKETDKADRWRVKGEVLTAYMHQVEPGMTSIDLPNFYDGEALITIDLSPQKSPADNAQALFSRYQKLKNRREFLVGQIQETKQEIDYLASIQTQLDLAGPEDIEEIREELISEGYIKKKNKKKQKAAKKAKPHHYQTSDGVDVLVGRNNKQNDELTMKRANKSDYWFHVKDMPGSHAILKTDSPSDQDLLEAGQIAAYHSKGQMSSKVPVDYVQVKHVHKPNGAKPGFVIYENQETIFVTPDRRQIDQLKFEGEN